MNVTPARDESLSDLLDDWLDDLTNQGRSQHTLTSYRIGVTSFVASQGDSLSDFTKPNVRNRMSSVGFAGSHSSRRWAGSGRNGACAGLPDYLPHRECH